MLTWIQLLHGNMVSTFTNGHVDHELQKMEKIQEKLPSENIL